MRKKQPLCKENRSFSLFRRLKKKKIIFNTVFYFTILLLLHLNFSEKLVKKLKFYIIHAQVSINEILEEINHNISNIRYFLANDIDRILINMHNENKKMHQEIECLKHLESENGELRKLLAMKNAFQYSMVVAKVITVFSNDFIKVCVLDSGKSSGISEDDIVRNEDGLIGRIIEVYEDWSKVLLITDTNSNVPVKIGEHKVNAIINGDNSDKLKIAITHEDFPIKDGDTVETSGYGNIFYEKIHIGKVIEKNKKLFIEPAVKFNLLKYVSILTKNK